MNLQDNLSPLSTASCWSDERFNYINSNESAVLNHKKFYHVNKSQDLQVSNSYCKNLNEMYFKKMNIDKTASLPIVKYNNTQEGVTRSNTINVNNVIINI
jgi:hypothetical protein